MSLYVTLEDIRQYIAIEPNADIDGLQVYFQPVQDFEIDPLLGDLYAGYLKAYKQDGTLPTGISDDDMSRLMDAVKRATGLIIFASNALNHHIRISNRGFVLPTGDYVQNVDKAMLNLAQNDLRNKAAMALKQLIGLLQDRTTYPGWKPKDCINIFKKSKPRSGIVFPDKTRLRQGSEPFPINTQLGGTYGDMHGYGILVNDLLSIK